MDMQRTCPVCGEQDSLEAYEPVVEDVEEEDSGDSLDPLAPTLVYFDEPSSAAVKPQSTEVYEESPLPRLHPAPPEKAAPPSPSPRKQAPPQVEPVSPAVPPELPEEDAANPLILIPAGSFIVGASDEALDNLKRELGLSERNVQALRSERPEEREVGEFLVRKYPVTREEYAEFVRETGMEKPAWMNRRGTSGTSARFPATGITFTEAEGFCQWRGERLPTSLEWERAARGTDGRGYPWGNRFKLSRGTVPCNTEEHGTRAPVPVDMLPEGDSPEGVSCLMGNGWEWMDGGWETRKYLRGASWEYTGQVYGLTWYRLKASPDNRDDDVGFRCVRNVHPFEAKPPADLQEMVHIPGGRFGVGIDEAGIRDLSKRFGLGPGDLDFLRRLPKKTLRMRGVRIRRYPVTNEEFWEFVQETGAKWPSTWSPAVERWLGRPFLDRYRYHPVTGVTCDQASQYATKKGGRLPSGFEWEVAGRWDTFHYYPWGDQFDAARCNMREKELARTCRVDAQKPQTYGGIYDLVGNVSEWVEPSWGKSGAVRGGNFSDRGEIQGLLFLEVGAEPELRNETIGFRYVE